MKDRLAEAIMDARTLQEVQGPVMEVVSSLKKNYNRVGFVAGMISSDGLDKIPQNLERLKRYENLLEKKYPGATFFCAADVFTPVVYDRIEEMKLPREQMDRAFMEFWRGVFKTGFISDISFTPRWKMSIGARDEHEVVTELNMKHQFILEIRSEILMVRDCWLEDHGRTD